MPLINTKIQNVEKKILKKIFYNNSSIKSILIDLIEMSKRLIKIINNKICKMKRKLTDFRILVSDKKPIKKVRKKKKINSKLFCEK